MIAARKTGAPPAVAYSYIRFSHPSQAEGDSLRRQTEAAAAWCERNGVRLDTTLTLRDLGVSAFKGAHRKDDRHALAGFLKLVEGGKVPRGSHLLIENLDRLSREDEVPACHLLTGILVAGVNVVQLSPYEMLLTEKSNGWELMRAVMELSRGHGESAIKSQRVGQAWEAKRARAREGGELLTHKLPAWVREDGGRLALVAERAAAVRRVFALSAAGYGNCGIVRRLSAEGVPAFGKSGRWAKSYVSLILADRRAVGEFQPRRRDGTPEGDPIPNYLPAVVSEHEWLAARAGASQRRKRRGRVSACPNVFAGLLRHARDGDSYFAVTNHGRSAARRVLVNLAGHEGRGKRWSFPLAAFEAAVLSLLREVDPRDVLGREGPGQADAIEGELAEVRARSAALEVELSEGDIPALARELRRLGGREKELQARLLDEQEKAAVPLAAAWKDAHSLMGALDAAPDPADARIRLRAALRRVVESAWLLVVGRGHDRLAALQIFFAGGERSRSYLILSRPPKANGRGRTEGGWWARSLAAVVKAGDLDLRRPEDAAALEELLTALDLDVVVGEPPAKVARQRQRAV
jgi:DNA invertase Pin-like site-specific DNA recombinase